MWKIRLFFIIFSALFCPVFIFADDQTKITINEICWMGNATSANDEWIELYNPNTENIKIDNWIFKTTDNGISLILKGEIPSQGFFLLERTDDTSVKEVKADLIYTGALSNAGEHLILLNEKGAIIDELDCASGWLTGDNATKQTMEKTGAGWPAESPAGNQAGWQTSQNPNGTPRAINSIKQINNNENTTTENAVNLADRQGSLQNVTATRLPYIFLSEILPSPEGSDTENEFIEIFNANNFEVDVSGFKIKDKTGAVKTFTIPEGTKILANEFLTFKSSQTKISLNNAGDGVEFLDPSEKIIDSTDFEKSSQGQSWSKSEANWSWSIQITPNKPNIIEQPKIATTSQVSKIPSTQANPSTGSKQENKPIVATIIAVIIASGSAVIAWQIKKKSTEI